MKKVTNRATLNRYSNFAIKKPTIKKIELAEATEPVITKPEIVQEALTVDQYAISDEMVTIYENIAVEPIPEIEEVKSPRKLPPLKLIVEKVLLEKKLERINGWLLK
jgi:hypothetical protein